jgi:hypothetical protein
MSPVPGFDARGLLPPYIGPDETAVDRSPYGAAMTEIVVRLAATSHRRNLLKGLLDYRQLLNGLGYTAGLQFIDGSFVEDVETREARDPKDIDVFSFLERPLRYRNDPAIWATVGFSEWSNEIVNRPHNMSRFNLDTYAVAVDQVSGLDVILATTYWSSLFAHKRITHDWKGFLRVPLNFADDVAARALL